MVRQRKIFVHEDNKEYMDFILKRDNLFDKAIFESREHGFWLYINATRAEENELIEDMMLEKLRMSRKCKVPYYSVRTMKNSKKRKRLAKFYGTTSCRCTKEVSTAMKQYIA